VDGYGDYLVVFAIAAVGTFVFTFPVRRIALRTGAIDQPGIDRVHEKPMPVIGGSALFLAFALAVGVASRLPGLEQVFRGSSEPLGVLVAGGLIYIVGLIDDVRDISAPAKVAGQVLAAMVLVFLGVTMYYFKVPFVSGIGSLSPSVLPLITALWVVGMTNAVNLIDGLDGLAAGICAIASAALCIYGLRLVHLGELGPDDLGPLVAAATCGACVGFLPHNFHPAKIIMGDGGALFLGLELAAATMVIGGRTENGTGGIDVSGLTFFRFAPLFIPFFILGVPMVDTAFAIIRRTARRSSFAERDLGHLHHRLVRLGHGHRRAVLILWAWTALLSAFVLVPTFDDQDNAFVPIGVGVLGVGLYTVFRPGGRGGAVLATRHHHPVEGPLAEEDAAATRAAGTGRPSAPITVVMSASAGVAVAGEPDLASPRRRRRRRRVLPAHLRSRAARREDASAPQVAGNEDPTSP
jgi:UDP-GlcNAc:undecaprenyl-phosphate GlcNAc-1-phosphate transferase